MEKSKPKRKVGRPANTGKYGAKTQVMRVPTNRVADIEKFLQSNVMGLPLFSSKVAAGGPIFAEDHVEAHVDLNEYLVSKPNEAFLLQVTGESMRDAGIFNGDLLIVELSNSPRHGEIVVAELDGQTTVKRWYKKGGECRLLPENPDFSPIEVDDSLRIVGVVKHVIHSF